LRVRDVISLPPKRYGLTLGNMERLVETGVDVEITRESQDVSVATFTRHRVSPTGKRSQRIWEQVRPSDCVLVFGRRHVASPDHERRDLPVRRPASGAERRG